jgi:hypothetical protein
LFNRNNSFPDVIVNYNNDRCIWKLAKLPPKKYYEYLKTGIYPEPEEQDEATSRGSAP